MTSTPLRTAGRLFGIDLAGLFRDDENGEGGGLNLQPFLQFTNTGKGRGGALSFRPQQQTGTTSTLGFGSSSGGINNINVVGSNIGQNLGGNVDLGGGDTTPTEPSEPSEPTQPQPYFTPEAVRFSREARDYTKDLSRQEAVGKANQLLKRAVGDKLTTQEQYNRLFDPLLKDLQEGDDYGFDIDRFYKNVEKEGFTPYEGIGVAGKLGSGNRNQQGAYGEYVNMLFGKDKTFFDQKDAGRRFLEAKAFYRPGGEDTQLDRIGQIQGRFDQGEMKFRGAGGEDYGTGYRAGTVGDRLRPFYETYMKEQGFGVTPNPEGFEGGSSSSNSSSSNSSSSNTPTNYAKFADYDFASQGAGGFGMADIESLLGEGANIRQLRALRDRARVEGKNVGGRAERLLQRGGQKSGGDFSNFDFSAYGKGGFGMADITELLNQGATRKDIKQVGRRAKEEGVNIGDRAKSLFRGLR